MYLFMFIFTFLFFQGISICFAQWCTSAPKTVLETRLHLILEKEMNNGLNHFPVSQTKYFGIVLNSSLSLTPIQSIRKRLSFVALTYI